ncbi:MAG: universal stress protein [Sphingobacteriaceae bacterium]|nr:universal stress protein [Sphingobacteriaceae bacterium]
MKTILVATDYTDSAESAFKYAAFIASFIKADVALFNNYTFDIHSLNGLITASAMGDMIRKNKLRLDEYAEGLSLKYKRPIKAFSLTTMTTESLEEILSKLGVGLLVMGMKKNAGEYHFSGNTSNAIIKNSKVPVLVVPDKIVLKMPERILYACDYQNLPKDEHLKVLIELVKAFGSELQVFHVNKHQTAENIEQDLKAAFLNKMENAISSLNHTYCDVNSKDFMESLKLGLNNFNADILVMSPHKYGFWTSLIHKSKTKEMALTSEIPLLSIPS